MSNGAHPSDHAPRELWAAILCDSLEYRRVVPTSESPTTQPLTPNLEFQGCPGERNSIARGICLAVNSTPNPSPA